jgi:type III pantothenate kinase
MLLAIDIGNTNIVAGLVKDGKITVSGRLETGSLDARVWRLGLDDLFAAQSAWPLGLEGAIVSSVVPAATGPLLTLLRSEMNLEPLLIGAPGVAHDIKIAFERPEEIGSDRLVNVAAGWARYGEPLIIVDFGTATTFDVVGPECSYMGGPIAPGINLALKALYESAALLPEIDVAPPQSGKVMGANTADAMRSGIYWGYVGLIEGLIARIQAETGPAKVIATGGLAPLFADQIPIIEATHEHLTLEGLAEIYKLNTAGKDS